MSGNDQQSAAAAVLVKSEDMPADAQKVEELDFNQFKDKPITVEDLIGGMTNMGFQASSIGEAVKIINDMVCHVDMFFTSMVLSVLRVVPSFVDARCVFFPFLFS